MDAGIDKTGRGADDSAPFSYPVRSKVGLIVLGAWISFPVDSRALGLRDDTLDKEMVQEAIARGSPRTGKFDAKIGNRLLP